MSDEATAGTEDGEPPKKKPKRPEGVEEPPLGFGRDLDFAIADPRDALVRAIALVTGVGLLFVFAARAGRGTDARLALVELCGWALLALIPYFVAVLVRNRGRTDFVVHITHRTLDVPRVALFGPMRITCGLHEMGPVSLMTNRGGLWIEAQPFHAPKLVMPQRWFEGGPPILEVYWRLALRVGVARRFRGKTERAAVVGGEAMVVLSKDRAIVGVVLSRTTTKRPVVIATVTSIAEFFAKLASYPEDAKLFVTDEVHAAFTDAIGDPSRLV